MKRITTPNSTTSRSRRKRTVESDDYTIPTPSIDLVLQNIASQAVLSANADGDSIEKATAHESVEEVVHGSSSTSQSRVNRRLLLLDRRKDREENLHGASNMNYQKNVRLPPQAFSRLLRVPNRDADFLHGDKSSDSASESFAHMKAGSSSQAAPMVFNRPRIMRNAADMGTRLYSSRFSYAAESSAGSMKSSGPSVLNVPNNAGLLPGRASADNSNVTTLSEYIGIGLKMPAPVKLARLVAITDDSVEKESQRELVELDAENDEVEDDEISEVTDAVMKHSKTAAKDARLSSDPTSNTGFCSQNDGSTTISTPAFSRIVTPITTSAHRTISSNMIPPRSRPSNGAEILNRAAATNTSNSASIEINGGMSACNGCESFTPFCKNCVAEFPRLLKSLDNLDARIDKMSMLMRMALETARHPGAENTAEIAKSIALFRQCDDNNAKASIDASIIQ